MVGVAESQTPASETMQVVPERVPRAKLQLVRPEDETGKESYVWAHPVAVA